MAPGRLFLILGPSGAGKTTLVRCLRERLPGLRHPASYTTREPRPSERDSGDYHFVSTDDFLRLRDSGALLEWDQPHGSHYYGIPAEPLLSHLSAGETAVREIAVAGLQQVLAGPAAPFVVSCFLLPRTADLAARLARRGESAAEARLARAAEEMALADQCDHVVPVVEDDPVATCDQVERIIHEAAAGLPPRPAS
jgi:guanylate kinase